jgi:hypothetical protein
MELDPLEAKLRDPAQLRPSIGEVRGMHPKESRPVSRPVSLIRAALSLMCRTCL